MNRYNFIWKRLIFKKKNKKTHEPFLRELYGNPVRLPEHHMASWMTISNDVRLVSYVRCSL